jgi:hypothetical protein
MTAPERIIARLAAIQPSRNRAQARNAEVRLNSDGNPRGAHPKMHNGTAFRHGTRVRAPRIAAPRPWRAPQVICRPLKSHR